MEGGSVSDDCWTGLAHAARGAVPATTTIASGGAKWRCCDACSLLFTNAPTKAVFKTLTATVEVKPPDVTGVTAGALSAKAGP